MQPDSSTTPLYVAIDIGKNVHSYAAYASADLRVVQPPQEVLSCRAGYEQFCAWLAAQLASGRYQPVIVGLEPTGIYHESWVDQLLTDFEQQVELRQVDPYAVRQKRSQLHSGRKKKTDALDDEAIAHCLRDGQGYPARPRTVPPLRFSLWATALRQLQQALYRQQRQVLAQIDRLWPGALLNVDVFHRAHPQLVVPEPLVRTAPLTRKQVQLLFRFRPNPYDWLPADPKAICRFYHTHHLRCGPKQAARLQQVLERCLFPTPEVAALLAERLQTDLQHYLALSQRLDDLLQQAQELLPGSPAAVLITAPGIAPLLAARYFAFVADPHRFQHADQIWALAGFDLIQNDSGDRRRLGKLTKRGEGAFRQVLFTIGVTMSQACPPIAAAKRRALRHGKGKTGAILHASHKANRLLFRLLHDQVPFDGTKLH